MPLASKHLLNAVMLHTDTPTPTPTLTHTRTHTVNQTCTTLQSSHHMQSDDGACSILRYHHGFLVFSIPVVKVIGEEAFNQLQMASILVPSIVAIDQDDVSKLGLWAKQAQDTSHE